jgi:hypothetical protein
LEANAVTNNARALDVIQQAVNSLAAGLEQLRHTDDWIDQHASPIGKRAHLEAVRRGELPGRKVGHLVLVRRGELDAFIERHRVRPGEAVGERRGEERRAARRGGRRVRGASPATSRSSSTMKHQQPRTGGWRWVSERRYMRIRLGGERREVIPLPACRTDEEADVRCQTIATIAAELIRAGRVDKVRDIAVQLGAAVTQRQIDAAVAGARLLVLQEGVAPNEVTFGAQAKRWTSGELARVYPDHVAKKDSWDDEARLRKWILPHVEDVPIVAFRETDAARVMASLPPELSSASRRHVAQIMVRVLRLSVFPCRIIPHSPIPEGFLPRLGADKAKPYLYPKEYAKLLGCPDVPLSRRLAYGILANEGMRASELLGSEQRKTKTLRQIAPLAWSDIDLELGVVHLDANKTDDPRSWALDAGVVAGFRVWRSMHPDAKPSDPVLTVEDRRHLAADLRRDLLRAGITREQLFERSASRSRIVAHHLRATFVTLALANGRTETWVQDRTGHTTSLMINRYRRAARTAAEIGLGPLAPLVQAIPELASAWRAQQKAEKAARAQGGAKVGQKKSAKGTNRAKGKRHAAA